MNNQHNEEYDERDNIIKYFNGFGIKATIHLDLDTSLYVLITEDPLFPNDGRNVYQFKTFNEAEILFDKLTSEALQSQDLELYD